MKSFVYDYTLSNGVKIPCIGFGTWQMPEGETGVSSVLRAIETGYRHIDTAAIYGNEKSVGEGMLKSGVPRNELFLTTKLWNDDRGYNETFNAFNESLEKLQTDYVDLYLIHWPNPKKFRNNWKEKNAESWKAMETLLQNGKAKAIGVSNFCPRHLDALLETAEVAPHVNQIKLCPGEMHEDTVQYCRQKNILLEAYSPLGTGKIFSVKEAVQMAEKYGRSVAQICIKFSLQNGFLPLPKSVSAERIKENIDVFNFELENEDVALLASLTGCCGEIRNPDEIGF